MSSLTCRKYNAAADDSSLARLVREHTELVRRIARHVAARLPPNIDPGDLVQSGMIGLMEAARQFEEGRGALFTTFASIRIRGAMLDEVRKGDWVPRSVHRGMRAVAQARRRIEQAAGRRANAAEIAAAMGIDIQHYHRLLDNASRGHLLSLEEQFSQGSEPRLAACTPCAEQALEREELTQELGNAIAALPEREQLMLSLYYEQALNMREIGLVLGVSESRVCQLHRQAMTRLRERLTQWHEAGVAG